MKSEIRMLIGQCGWVQVDDDDNLCFVVITASVMCRSCSPHCSAWLTAHGIKIFSSVPVDQHHVASPSIQLHVSYTLIQYQWSVSLFLLSLNYWMSFLKSVLWCCCWSCFISLFVSRSTRVRSAHNSHVEQLCCGSLVDTTFFSFLLSLSLTIWSHTTCAYQDYK